MSVDYKSAVELKKPAYDKAAEVLRNMIREAKDEDIIDVLTDERVEMKLREEQCDETVIRQICIFLTEGKVAHFVTQNNPGPCSVDVNNIVMAAMERSGLDQRTIIILTELLFYALIIPTEQHFSVKLSGGNMKGIWAVTSKNDEETLRQIREDIEAEDDNLQIRLQELDKLADAGIPDALYLKGRCYYLGIGTPKDELTGLQYLLAASNGGSAEANAMLGDYYFYTAPTRLPDPTEAFERYTALGAVALDERRKNNLRILLEERKLNQTLLLVNSIFFIMMLTLTVFISKGVFTDGKPHWVWGSLTLVFIALTFALSVFQKIKKPFNDQHWAVPVMAVFVLILLLIIL